MAVFEEDYATYYDLLYKNKKYDVEADYVADLLMDSGITKGNLLDVGCGTGKHLIHMRNKGFSITGVDPSKNMIKYAKKELGNDINLQISDAKSFSFSKKFDVITSLFHVFSYITDTADVVSALKNIAIHLQEDGRFIFDFWHGAGCLTDFPKTKFLKLENEIYSIIRLTEPFIHFDRNVIDVNFEVHLIEKKTNITKIINETHSMRYFFLPELEYYLNIAGLKVEKAYRWLSSDRLDSKAWYGVIVAKKDS